MSTIERLKSPPLEAGHASTGQRSIRRYEAMPPETRAELIGGVVYMPSPLSLSHGRTDSHITCWLVIYERATSGVERRATPRSFLTTKVSLSPMSCCGSSPNAAVRAATRASILAAPRS